MVQLDGGNTIIGTEFIKLLNTGSSNLATEEYVNTVAGGGGGAVDAYTKTETDNLLNTKLNVNNPQDIEGTLRLGSVGGTSKIIVNALSSTKDFYVNGDAQVLGNHLVASLDSTSYIKGTNIITNTINADNLNDIYFQSNGVSYLQLDVSENKLVSSKLIQCGGNLTTQEIDTIANLDLVIKRNNIDYITLSEGQINFNQPTNISVDTTNLVKKTGETDQRVDGTVSVNGDTVAGYELTVAGQVHTQGMYVASDTDLIFGNPTQYITNPFGTAHIRHYANGEHQFYCNGLEDFLIDQDKALARGNMLCVGQFQGSVFNSYNNNTVDVSFRKANVELMKLGGAKVMAYFPLGVASNIYDSVDNADVIFKRNFVDFFYLRNNTVDLNAGISLASDGISCNELSSKSDSDLTFQRAGVNYITLTDGQINFNNNTALPLGTQLALSSDLSRYIYGYDTGNNNSLKVMECVVNNSGGLFRVTVNNNTHLQINNDGTQFWNVVNVGAFPIAGVGSYIGCNFFNTIGEGDFAIEFKRFNNLVMKFETDDTITVSQPLSVANCNATTRLETPLIKSNSGSDLTFQRDSTNVMKLNSSNQLEFIGGNSKSVIYEETYFDLATFNVLRIRNTETADNRKISFGVGSTLDVLQITDTGISSAVEITSTQFLANSYDSFGDNDVSFKRNGTEFMKFDGSNNIIDVGLAIALSSNYLYCNYLSQRSMTSDMVFRGADGTNPVEFMRHRNSQADLQMSRPIFMNRQQLQFNKTTSEEVFIDNFRENGVEILQFRNNDTTGQNRMICGGNTIFDMSSSQFNIYQTSEVADGKILTANVVAHSDIRLKYNIEKIEHNFIDMVKSIEPKTFKLNREREMDIDTKHIGFIAQEVEENIPNEFENIVITDEKGMKKLSYSNMNCIVWGSVRELINENKDLRNKVEHLEATMFEMLEEIKELKGKGKAKAKPKSKKSNID